MVSNSQYWQGYEITGARSQILDREDKGEKSKEKAHMARKGNPISAIKANILRPLYRHLARTVQRGRIPLFLRKGVIPLLCVVSIVLFFYLVCLKIGLIEYFQYLLFKILFVLSSRCLSFLFLRWGFPGFFSWGVGFVLRGLFDPEATPPPGNLMLPAGDAGASSSNPFPRWNVDLNRPPREEVEVPVDKKAPGLDLNKIPTPSPEPGPEPAPPAPLSVEEELLITKRKEVKFLIRVLLQIGYQKRARNEKEIKQLFQDIDIDSERNASFLEELHDHLQGLRRPGGHGGTSGQPQKFSNIEVQELLRWISEKRGN